MSNRINHAVEAVRILAEPGYGFAEGNDPHGAAQVHATLALVEQLGEIARILTPPNYPYDPSVMSATEAQHE